MRLKPHLLNTLILQMKIKPYYVLLKYNMKHPENKYRTNQYDIWKEYWDDYVFDSILYEVIDFFDSLKDARQRMRELKNG